MHYEVFMYITPQFRSFDPYGSVVNLAAGRYI